MLLGGAEQSNINILCTSFCRVDKRIAIVGSGYVCLVTTLVQSLASAADGLAVTPPGQAPGQGRVPPTRLSDWERGLLGGVGWEARLCPALGPERDTEKEMPDEELC